MKKLTTYKIAFATSQPQGRTHVRLSVDLGPYLIFDLFKFLTPLIRLKRIYNF
jgi:hypothetical protein